HVLEVSLNLETVHTNTDLPRQPRRKVGIRISRPDRKTRPECVTMATSAQPNACVTSTLRAGQRSLDGCPKFSLHVNMRWSLRSQLTSQSDYHQVAGRHMHVPSNILPL